MGRALLVVASLGVLGGALPAAAQRAAGARRGPLPASDSAAPRESAAPPTRPHPAAAGLSGRATPRSIQVLMVAVPPQFRASSPVAFVVRPSGEATLLPPLAGVLPPTGAAPRTLAVAASVPAGAAAGLWPLATVQFSQDGAPAATVPLTLAVSQVRGVVLRLTQQLFGARAGEPVTIHYLLTNTGNAVDTLDLAVVVPAGWPQNAAPRRYILGRGASTSGDVTVAVPVSAVSGSFRVRLSVFAGQTDLADADAVLEFLEAPGGRATLGPRLVAGVASVWANGQSASPVFGFELSGPISDQIQAFGRLVQASNPGAVDQRDLPRVGYFVGAPFLTLMARTWQVTAGTTGRSFSDVTGISAYGRGASVAWSDSQSSVTALAAAPAAVDGGASRGHLFGLRVASQIWAPGGQLNATVTHLDDPQFGGRRLAAVGLGAVTPPFAGVTVSGELAERQFEAGSGLGWLTELTRQTRADYGQLRLVHAPGGSAAFARAREEFSAVGSRALSGRLSLGAGVWTSDDDNTTFSRLHTAGWSVAPRFALTPTTSLELEARSSAFESHSAAGVLGNGETVVRVGVTTQRGTLYWSGGASLGSASETAGLPGGPVSETAAGRQSVRAAGGLATPRGTLEVSASLEHNGPGIGYLPLQSVVGVRVARLPLSAAPQSPLVSLGLQHYGWFGDRPAVLVARLGVEAPLPGGLALTVDVERNPFLTGLTGGAQWIPVIKLEHAIHVPVGALEPAAKGTVYEDLNGNGMRDPGEPGVAGAVVRRGGETVITDRSGQFRFYERTDAPVRLDETSLPFGVIANPARPPERQPLHRIEIGLIPTAAVDVELRATADSTGRLPHVDFAGVPVEAVDSSGAAWSARADSGGRAHFYALPPGRYHLEVDVSGLREPVRLRGPAPSFTVEPGRAVPVLTVPVYPRPIRVFQPASPGPHGPDATPPAPRP